MLGSRRDGLRRAEGPRRGETGRRARGLGGTVCILSRRADRTECVFSAERGCWGEEGEKGDREGCRRKGGLDSFRCFSTDASSRLERFLLR